MLKNDKNVIATASWHRGLPSACGSTPPARVLIYRWCASRQRGTVLTVTQWSWVHWSSPKLIWLVVFFATPVKNMSSSVGMMTFPIIIWKKNVPNHQSVIYPKLSKLLLAQHPECFQFNHVKSNTFQCNPRALLYQANSDLFRCQQVAFTYWRPSRIRCDCVSQSVCTAPDTCHGHTYKKSSIVWTIEPHWINSLMYT